MDIKGVSNLDNSLNVKSSQADSLKEPAEISKKTEAPSQTSKSEKAEANYKASNSRVKQIMQDMKSFENTVSRDQYYLEKLSQVKNLTSRKTVPDLYVEMIKIRNEAMFAREPVMNSIIPDSRDFYRNYDNIKAMQRNVAAEIERVKATIHHAQNQINKFNISLENIKASVSQGDVRQMQHLFSQNMLYKNFNKDIVISLMT